MESSFSAIWISNRTLFDVGIFWKGTVVQKETGLLEDTLTRFDDLHYLLSQHRDHFMQTLVTVHLQEGLHSFYVILSPLSK